MRKSSSAIFPDSVLHIILYYVMGNSLYRKSDRKAIILLLVMALAGMLLFYYSGEDMTDGLSQESIAGSLSSGDGSVTVAGTL